MRRRLPIALAALLAATAAAPPAAAQDPPRVAAEPGGIYAGTMRVERSRCDERCRIRIVVSSDGLDVRPSSTLIGGGFRRGCQGGYVELAPIDDDGRWRSNLFSESFWMPVRGRFTHGGRRVSGRGRIQCSSTPRSPWRYRSFRFTARLVGHRPAPDPGRVFFCERIEHARAAMTLPIQRGLGCGRAHRLARDVQRLCPALQPGATCRASGLECSGRDSGTLDGAAQVRCAERGAVVELVRFTRCGTVRSEAVAYAANGVPCEEAERVTEDALAGCEDFNDPCQVGPYDCGPRSGNVRCTDRANVRRVVEFLYAPSSSG